MTPEHECRGSGGITQDHAYRGWPDRKRLIAKAYGGEGGFNPDRLTPMSDSSQGYSTGLCYLSLIGIRTTNQWFDTKRRFTPFNSQTE
jgi:hypothetical protein